MPSPNFGDRRGKGIDALILHYTGMRTGADALAWLCGSASGVSCHYLVWEDGRIDQLVGEVDRAWHAGRSYWAGARDINALSIGIEIVNGGHDFGRPPYPDAQIDAVIALAKDVCGRNAIGPDRVLAHSDIAPDRKTDPGEHFPWAQLAAQGIGLWVEAPTDTAAGPILAPGEAGDSVSRLQRDLAAFGYESVVTGLYDERTACLVTAFQRHFHPLRIDGVTDASTRAILTELLRRKTMRRGA